MKMNCKDALSILKASNQSTAEDIKLAYRRACRMYHPDKNPAGLEMMKLINLAYEALQGYVATDKADNAEDQNYGEDLNSALNAIIALGLNIEICGSWIWVSGDTKPHKEILKSNGFKWAPQKEMWHFRPASYKSFSRGKWDMSKIRATHGSVTVKAKYRHGIEERA